MVAIDNFSAAKTQKPVKISTMRSEQYINTVTGQFVGPTPAKLAMKTTLERSKLEATAKLDKLGKVIEKSKLSNLEASNNQQFISKSDVTYFDKKQLWAPFVIRVLSMLNFSFKQLFLNNDL